jgi:hypothetical protein
LPTFQHLIPVVTRLFFLEPVALGAKLIDLVEHPFQQGVSRGAGYSGILKLTDFTAQSLNLTTPVLDVSTNEIDLWHVPNSRQNKTTPEPDD